MLRAGREGVSCRIRSNEFWLMANNFLKSEVFPVERKIEKIALFSFSRVDSLAWWGLYELNNEGGGAAGGRELRP